MKQMQTLGIDYGRRKIGLALSYAGLAEPFKVLRVKGPEEGLNLLTDLVKAQKYETIVIGVSEGSMGEEARRFGEELKKMAGVPVVFQDETLSTQDAQRFAIEAGIKRKKRKELEDAFSAALILQDYLDTNR